MKKNKIKIQLCATIVLSTLTSTGAEFGNSPDPFTGNWAGTRTVNGETQGFHSTVIHYDNHYEVSLRKTPNPRISPEAIMQGKPNRAVLELPATLGVNRDQVIRTQDGGVLIKTSLWNGRIVDGKLIGQFSGEENGTFKMKRQSFAPSPTLNAKPPTTADLLYDGNGLALWDSYPHSGQEIQWKETKNGLLEVNSYYEGKRRKQDIRTRKEYSDYKLHLEFMLAYMPNAKGQGRSNSGIFHMGRYETQILDSFGLYGRDNECGGIYTTRVPDSNAAYPPGFWQTYDVDFTAPKFDAAGKKTSDAIITVRLNGVVVHHQVKLPHPTWSGFDKGKEGKTGPIILQDHGNTVQFRNIWISEN